MRAVFLAAVLVSSSCAPALAIVYYVNNSGTGDFPTIQAALDAAAPGDSIALGSGSFRGRGNRDLRFHGKRLTLYSLVGNPAHCWINCEDETVGIVLDAGEPEGTLIEGITIARGYSYPVSRGGGVQVRNGSWPTFRNCVVRDCRATPHYGGAGGGGVFSENSAPLFEACAIIGNFAEGYKGASDGGGLLIEGGSATLRGCRIAGNADWGDVYGGSRGGGISAIGDASVVFEDCVITGNVAARGGETGGLGGGIYVGSHSIASIVGCTIAGNEAAGVPWAPSAGGAIAVAPYEGTAAVTVDRTIIYRNCGGSEVHVEGGTSSASLSCSIVDTSAMSGGGQITVAESVFFADPLFCAPGDCSGGSGGDYQIFFTSPAAPGNHPEGFDCGLIGAVGIADCAITPVAGVPPRGPVSSLRVAGTPATGTVNLRYGLGPGGRGPSFLAVFDAAGRLVRRFALSESEGSVEWNGTTETGAQAGAGVYLVLLEAHDVTIARRVVLLE